MKMLCITMREASPDPFGYTYDMLDLQWYTFFQHLNILCVPLPNVSRVVASYLDSIKPSAVVLSGGGDPYCLSDITTERDRTERAAVNWCASNSVPVIGVCRGMQVLLSLHGVRLVPVEQHVDLDHLVFGSTSRSVNSYHRYGAYEAGDFEILSTSSDGVVEQIQDCSRLHFGMMWHPERNSPPHPQDLEQFAAWIQLAVAVRHQSQG